MAKNSTRTGSRKSSASRKSAPTRKSATKSAVGNYTVPKGNVSLSVPSFWTLRQTNDDLEVEAPSGATSVIVTAFQRNGSRTKLDAREYLQHFLETAPRNGRLQAGKGSKQRAVARFKDSEGDLWDVAFVSDGRTLLLATCNTSLPASHKESKTGVRVIESVKLK